MALDVTHYLQDCLQDRELHLPSARLEAAAQEISDYIVESEIDEQMRLLDARLSKSALDIGRCVEEEEKAAERERQLIECEARLLKAAGEIEQRLQVLERGLPLSANRADAFGDEDWAGSRAAATRTRHRQHLQMHNQYDIASSTQNR